VSVRTIALRTARKRAETALKRVWSLETGPKAADTAADVEGESPSGAAVGDGQAGDGDGFTGSNVKHATRAVQVAPLQRQEFENLQDPPIGSRLKARVNSLPFCHMCVLTSLCAVGLRKRVVS
jgi:hypothetical protein